MSLEYKVLGQGAATSVSQQLEILGFVGVSDGLSSKALDGVTWSSSALPIAHADYVAYGAGKFVAIGSDTNTNSHYTSYSTDGVNWTVGTMPTTGEWTGLTFGDGKFVAVGYDPNTSYGEVAYSSDGISWTKLTLSYLYYKPAVTYGDGKYVIIAEDYAFGNGRVAYSADAITWTEITPVDWHSWNSVVYGDGKFVAVAFSSAFGDAFIAYSADAITWTQAAQVTFTELNSVTYGNGKFVALGRDLNTYNGSISYSLDGISWTNTVPLAYGLWTEITYGNGKFVAVGLNTDTMSGMLAYSTDGVTWTQSSMPIATGVTYAESLVDIYNAVEAYTTPSSTSAITSSIYIANTATSEKNYSVAVVPDGETLSSIHYIRKDVAIDGNDFQNIPTKITLSAGDKIITNSSSAEVSINVFGVEK